MTDTYVGAYGLPEDAEPLTAGEDIVPTIYGEENFAEPDADVTTDPDGGTATTTLDPDLISHGLASSVADRARLAGGLYNADFKLGPPRTGEAVDENNPLPYWKQGHTQTGAVFLLWNGWGDSGYLTAEAYDATDGDDVYLEQVVPVSGYANTKVVLPMCQFGTDITDAGGTYDLYGYIEYELYDRAGASLGTALIAKQGYGNHNAPGDDEAAFLIVDVPETAKWMRVRIYVVAETPASGYQRQYIVGSSAAPPRLSHFTILSSDDGFNTTGETALFVVSHTSGTTAIGSGATQWVSPGYGWVRSASLRLDAARTNATAWFALYDLSNSVWVGPMLRVNASNDGNSAPYLYGNGSYYPDNSTATESTHKSSDPQYNYIQPGDRFAGRVSVTGGTYAPSGTGVLLINSIAIIDELLVDNRN